MRRPKASLVLGIALVISGAIFSACNKTGEINEVYFTENCKVYDPKDQLVDTLRGEMIIEEAFGGAEIVSVDSILCVVTTDNSSMFLLYSTKGDSLAAVGVRGQGPNDFTTGWTYGMRYDNGDDIGIWVIDVNSARLKGLNLSKSLIEGKSIVDTALVIDPMVMNAAFSDGKIVELYPVKDNYELRILSADDQTVLYKEPLFKFDMNEAFDTYYCDMGLSPDGRYLIMTMRVLNEVNIVDLKDYSRVTASVGNVPHKDEINTAVIYESCPTYSDDYIFSLSLNGTKPSDRLSCALHIFDYKGNFIANVPLDRHLRTITHVAKENAIYAIDYNETIYRYSLDSLNL